MTFSACQVCGRRENPEPWGYCHVCARVHGGEFCAHVVKDKVDRWKRERLAPFIRALLVTSGHAHD